MNALIMLWLVCQSSGFEWQCTRAGTRIVSSIQKQRLKKRETKGSQHSPKTVRTWMWHGMVWHRRIYLLMSEPEAWKGLFALYLQQRFRLKVPCDNVKCCPTKQHL